MEGRIDERIWKERRREGLAGRVFVISTSSKSFTPRPPSSFGNAGLPREDPEFDRGKVEGGKDMVGRISPRPSSHIGYSPLLPRPYPQPRLPHPSPPIPNPCPVHALSFSIQFCV
ncbi:hypothetical protein E2C01_072712 [Portunus trituberculatus]|uniref:Uncharacterized protein n=1 Tax=Portunus trituberculatus TaxID=210409 RepID=A0A5B7IBF0_PORTR|nr:hypothetical protein [Portunus trituberculatus]